MEYSFNTEHAKLYGVNEAIMIKNFQFWITKNKANKYSEHDGRTWTYNSTRAFKELFTFWSTGQINRILKSLISQGVLMEGNYNKLKYDRTKWYAFVTENAFIDSDNTICRKQEMDLPNVETASVEPSKPIPDTKLTDSNNKYYKQMLTIYNDFCLQQFDAPCKINGLEGKSLKQIIKYLIQVSKAKGHSDDGCIDSFRYILANWSKLDSFTQKQVKLSQINSNITNIINQLKNGTKAQRSNLAQEILAKYQQPTHTSQS